VYILRVPDTGLSGVGPGVAALRALVAKAKRESGSSVVDVVGHSQGGLIARAYVKLAGGDREGVARVVSMNTPQHGLDDWYAPVARAIARSRMLSPLVPVGLLEQLPGSSFLRALNAGDETPDSVAFTSIYSTDSDSIVKPAGSPILDGATNVGLVTPRRTMLGQRRRGPHHFMVNHFSVEAYLQLRLALLGEPPLAPGVAAAIAGAAALRASRR
jgi:triacylglycerol esterase/lipase EstA (alpha/beta hydrolase family)